MPIDADSIKAHLPELSDIRHICTGGQKSVFCATHPEHGSVAVKVILNSNSDQRVLREIEIITSNDFSNVPNIYAYRTLLINGNKTLYIIEQFLEGTNLRDMLRAETCLSVDIVTSFLSQMLTTISQLEEAHLVHRDIKPENVILDCQGALKIGQ